MSEGTCSYKGNVTRNYVYTFLKRMLERVRTTYTWNLEQRKRRETSKKKDRNNSAVVGVLRLLVSRLLRRFKFLVCRHLR